MKNPKFLINYLLLQAYFISFLFWRRRMVFLMLLGMGCNQTPHEADAVVAIQQQDSLIKQAETGANNQLAPLVFDKYIRVDSASPPEIVPLKRQPISRSAYPNRYPAGQPKVISLPEKLTVITPGKGGVPLPKIVAAKGIIVPARQPKAVPAFPPRYKEGAAIDLKVLEIDMGQNSNNISAIMEDSRGDFWFGTGAGAIRYDGKTMQLFTEKEGLVGNRVWKILEDHKGRIWFTTLYTGLTCYDGSNFIQFTENKELFGNMISSILEDDDGKIWIGSDGGVTCFDGTNFTTYTLEEGLSSNNVNSIYEDSRGNLWIGTGRAGVCRFDGESFTHFSESEGLSGNMVFCITEDADGNIWFGTNNGASCFNGRSFINLTETEGLIGNFVRTLVQDKDGRFWISSMDRGALSKSGLSCYDGKTWTRFTENEGLSKNRIYNLYRDTHGRIWGGSGNGVNIINLNGIVSFSNNNGFEQEQMVSDILEDNNGTFWIGTWSGGLIRFDRERFSYIKKEEGLLGPGNIINRIELDKTGNLWFDFGGQGVTRFDGKTFAHFTEKNLPHLKVPRLVDQNGNIWFWAKNSIVRFDGKGYFIFELAEGLSNTRLVSVIQDKKDNIWIATTNAGIIRFDGKLFTRFTDKDGLCSNFISPLFEDKKGNIWIGSNGDGLSCYDGTAFVNYTEKDGLGSNSVYNIAEDKQGVIWVTGDNGVSLLVDNIDRFPNAVENPETKSAYTIFHYDNKDGIIGKRLNAIYLDQHNAMWLGSEKGLMMLNLDNFKVPSKPPSIQLIDIAINQEFINFRMLRDSAYQQDLPLAKQLTGSVQAVIPFYNIPVTLKLPYDLNHLTFYFSAIDWSAPHKIWYSYYVKNVDKTWSAPQQESSADYRNLPAGTYTFRVRAIGASKMWSKPFEYKFTIYPPWYYSWWAYALYTLTLAGLFFSLRRYELNRQQAKSDARRLLELDHVKTRLYTNITHEFRTPLTVILGMEEQLRKDPDTWFDESLLLIRRNGKQLLHLVNQLLDLAKLESGNMPLILVHGDIVSYLQYLTESFRSFADSKDIRLHFRPELPELFIDYDAEKLQNVVSNLLSNAIKFTPAGGDVYVELRVENAVFGSKKKLLLAKEQPPAEILLKITDTGPGIPSEHLPHIFDRFYQADDADTRTSEGTGIGLALAKELVSIMGGKITVESSPGSGSSFHIRLPITDTAKDRAVENKLAPVPIIPAALIQEPEIATGIPGLDSGERFTVLVVEDNLDVITYISAVLAMDYHIISARNGQEGIQKAYEYCPDLIISDVMMPEKDGFELCQELKTDERSSHIPIILLTAKTDQKSKIAGLTHGADAYLSKPFSQEELLVRIEKLILLRRQLRERFQQAGILRKTLQNKAAGVEERFLQRIVGIVEAQLGNEEFGMPELCKALDMSRTNLFRKLKALTGQSVTIFIRSLRLEKARELLETTELNVGEVCFKVGFSSPNYFSRVFQEAYGMPPSELRKG